MFAAQRIQYSQTNSFSRIVTDYLSHAPELRSFYHVQPDLDGISEVIKKRKLQATERQALVQVLKDQYKNIDTSQIVKDHIQSFSSDQTFTVVTAHQPNLFTGPLYFIYKILHAVRLAADLGQKFPEHRFVPVYYMGSEDADLAELNHFTVHGKKYVWQTDQKGAVGRMLIDKKLLALIDELEHQIGIEPFGKELIRILRKSYQPGTTIQQATFQVVNALLGKYGVIVLIADDARLKKQMLPVFERDIFEGTSSRIVSKTSERLNQYYNTQAHPREINLFYLKENIRERIVFANNRFTVFDTQISFSKEEMKAELEQFPERFSPNVILRGLYQETILPNVAFIGGGGEMAYWLQLKDLFDHYGVVYPALILRNSFLVVENKWNEKIQKLGFAIADFFSSENSLMKRVVEMNSDNKVSLNGNFELADTLFNNIEKQAGEIDPTLSQHVAAIRARSLKTLKELEKKMLRAEKRKFSDHLRQIQKIREILFPKNGLQERVENIAGFYAAIGPHFIDELFKYSLALEQEFVILDVL